MSSRGVRGREIWTKGGATNKIDEMQQRANRRVKSFGTSGECIWEVADAAAMRSMMRPVSAAGCAVRPAACAGVCEGAGILAFYFQPRIHLP